MKTFEKEIDSFDLEIIKFYLDNRNIKDEVFPLSEKLIFNKGGLRFNLGFKKEGHLNIPQEILDTAQDNSNRRIDLYIKNGNLLFYEKY